MSEAAQGFPKSAWVPRGWLARDLAFVLGAGCAVQLVFLTRYDWVAHVLAGGAIGIALSAVLHTRVGPWAQPIAETVALLGAIASELIVTGPLDPSDVAFTLVGALLVTGPLREASDGPPWPTAVGWGLALLAAAYYYHYGIKWNL